MTCISRVNNYAFDFAFVLKTPTANGTRIVNPSSRKRVISTAGAFSRFGRRERRRSPKSSKMINDKMWYNGKIQCDTTLLKDMF